MWQNPINRHRRFRGYDILAKPFDHTGRFCAALSKLLKSRAGQISDAAEIHLDRLINVSGHSIVSEYEIAVDFVARKEFIEREMYEPDIIDPYVNIFMHIFLGSIRQARLPRVGELLAKATQIQSNFSLMYGKGLDDSIDPEFRHHPTMELFWYKYLSELFSYANDGSSCLPLHAVLLIATEHACLKAQASPLGVKISLFDIPSHKYMVDYFDALSKIEVSHILPRPHCNRNKPFRQIEECFRNAPADNVFRMAFTKGRTKSIDAFRCSIASSEHSSSGPQDVKKLLEDGFSGFGLPENIESIIKAKILPDISDDVHRKLKRSLKTIKRSAQIIEDQIIETPTGFQNPRVIYLLGLASLFIGDRRHNHLTSDDFNSLIINGPFGLHDNEKEFLKALIEGKENDTSPSFFKSARTLCDNMGGQFTFLDICKALTIIQNVRVALPVASLSPDKQAKLVQDIEDELPEYAKEYKDDWDGALENKVIALLSLPSVKSSNEDPEGYRVTRYEATNRVQFKHLVRAQLVDAIRDELNWVRYPSTVGFMRDYGLRIESIAKLFEEDKAQNLIQVEAVCKAFEHREDRDKVFYEIADFSGAISTYALVSRKDNRDIIVMEGIQPSNSDLHAGYGANHLIGQRLQNPTENEINDFLKDCVCFVAGTSDFEIPQGRVDNRSILIGASRNDNAGTRPYIALVLQKADGNNNEASVITSITYKNENELRSGIRAAFRDHLLTELKRADECDRNPDLYSFQEALDSANKKLKELVSQRKAEVTDIEFEEILKLSCSQSLKDKAEDEPLPSLDDQNPKAVANAFLAVAERQSNELRHVLELWQRLEGVKDYKARQQKVEKTLKDIEDSENWREAIRESLVIFIAKSIKRIRNENRSIPEDNTETEEVLNNLKSEMCPSQNAVKKALKKFRNADTRVQKILESEKPS